MVVIISYYYTNIITYSYFLLTLAHTSVRAACAHLCMDACMYVLAAYVCA